MPIDSKHPEYTFRLPQWTRTRDAIGGIDTLKQNIQEYIPKLSGQEPSGYAAYVKRASWYGATARTVSGLVGSIMRKPPEVEGPEELLEHFKDITLTGVPLESFVKAILYQVVSVARVGVLVDFPLEGAKDTRPYYVPYAAENVLNWSVRMNRGVPELFRVVLQEYVPDDTAKDEYEGKLKPQIKILRMNEKGYYQVDIYQKRKQEDGQEKYIIINSLIPNIRQKPFGFIPFCFFGEESLTPTTQKASLLDLVDMNLSHYRNSADLENGLHYLGVPTPWIAGEKPENSMHIGCEQAWTFSSPDVKVGFLEFTGQGLSALKDSLDRKEKLMAVLGARLLEQQQKQIESSDAQALRGSGETSILQSTASTVGQGMTKLARWHAMWLGEQDTDKIMVSLNTDFFDRAMSGSDLTALVQAWQGGAISHDTLYYNLQRGEVTESGITAEVERERIKLQAPDTGVELDPNFDEGGEGDAVL